MQPFQLHDADKITSGYQRERPDVRLGEFGGHKLRIDKSAFYLHGLAAFENGFDKVIVYPINSPLTSESIRIEQFIIDVIIEDGDVCSTDYAKYIAQHRANNRIESLGCADLVHHVDDQLKLRLFSGKLFHPGPQMIDIINAVACHSCSSGLPISFAIGKEMVKTLPFPAMHSASMCPPCLLTRSIISWRYDFSRAIFPARSFK